MRNDTFARALSAWAILLNGMRPLLEEIPHAREGFDRLQAAHDEMAQLNEQVEKLRSDFQEATSRRRKVMLDAGTTHQIMGAVLRGRFGLTSPELIQFGLKPRGRRKKKQETPVETKPAAPRAEA